MRQARDQLVESWQEAAPVVRASSTNGGGKEGAGYLAARSEIGETLEADDIARAIVYAVSQPPHVSLNEVLIRPTQQQN